MSYVPTLCQGCWHVHLATVEAAQRGETPCATCGAETRVVPGCSYGEGEREAFQELAFIVAEGRVTPVEAQAYGVETEQALWSASYTSLLEKLSVRLPGLLPHQVAAGKNTGAQRRILSKLKTILEALATARSPSAEYPVAATPAAAERESSQG
jgi:hypothetical protein